ncbi:hypothetical protein [Cryobacterium soli]|uniref:hypothetical protein n=1 Tax=Cryobacterium soli TaxID=2220095 RepID=UPI000E71FA24|nr:hypothetical protein [Cryobacterium soli]
MSEFIYQPGTPLGDAEREAERERQQAEYAAAVAARQVEREKLARFHSVTVTTKVEDEGTPDECRRVDEVKFTCTAAMDAECRTYPKHCGCEAFEWNEAETHDIEGHPRVSGNDCWMQDWFDNPGASYIGDDQDDMRDDCVPAIARTGLIIVSFVDEWIEWDWFTPAPAGSES